jgi:hypothetical protein
VRQQRWELRQPSALAGLGLVPLMMTAKAVARIGVVCSDVVNPKTIEALTDQVSGMGPRRAGGWHGALLHCLRQTTVPTEGEKSVA